MTNKTTHIRAARVWIVRDNILQSINRVPWEPGKPSEAVHPHTNFPFHGFDLTRGNIHVDSPARGCRCGLWGTKINKGEKLLWKYIQSIQLMCNKHENGYAVIGTVNFWGKIIEHKTGYRAQFGYPEKLFVFGPKAATIALNLSELYGVPAEPFTWEKWREALKRK